MANNFLKIFGSGEIFKYIRERGIEGANFENNFENLKGTGWIIYIADKNFEMAKVKSISEIAAENKILSLCISPYALNLKKYFDSVLEVEGNFEEIYKAVKGITDLMTVSYPRNKADVDWMDFKNFFEEVEAGKFIVSESEKSAADAMEKILQEIPATNNLLMNIIGGEDKLDILDVNEATEKLVKKFPDAEQITYGVTADESVANKIRVVIIMEVI